MNLPNKLTVLRICLVPVFLVFVYIDAIPYHYLLALIVFAIASITDAMDGHIARKNNMITDFGKFLDPLADKVLVISALACMVDMKIMNSIPLIIIVAREFMVSGLRLVTANEGIVVPAGIWGKLKTAFTMVTIVIAFFWKSLNSDFAIDFSKGAVNGTNIFIGILIGISVVLTIISGMVYLKAYWKYIDTDK